jgi:hypothetical protein
MTSEISRSGYLLVELSISSKSTPWLMQLSVEKSFRIFALRFLVAPVWLPMARSGPDKQQ